MLALLLLGGCDDEERAAETPPRDVVTAFLEAHNEHEMQRKLSYLAEDVRYYVEDNHLLDGWEEIRGLAEWDSVLLSVMEFGDYETRGDSLLVDRFTETNQWVQRMELERLTHLPGTLFRVDDGRIVEIRPAGLSDDSQRAVEDALSGFLEWAEPRFPEDVEILFDDEGRLVYTAESAQTWMRLLLRWHESEAPLEQTGSDSAP